MTASAPATRGSRAYLTSYPASEDAAARVLEVTMPTLMGSRSQHSLPHFTLTGKRMVDGQLANRYGDWAEAAWMDTHDIAAVKGTRKRSGTKPVSSPALSAPPPPAA